MKRLIPLLGLAVLVGLSCSKKKTEHAIEEAYPVKTYQRLKTQTDSIQSKAVQHSKDLDSVSGQ